jgi:hypothetical protein
MTEILTFDRERSIQDISVKYHKDYLKIYQNWQNMTEILIIWQKKMFTPELTEYDRNTKHLTEKVKYKG